ncbi:MAG TPA: hypothetical protein VI168_10850 [Croceibacterium sp.]
MTVPATAAAPSAARQFRPSFSFWMILAMCFFVFGGFGMHSFVPALQGDFPPAPPVVHLHGVVFIGWMLLLLVQSSLVSAGNVRLHRALGTWGIAQGTATILIGLMMQLVASGRGHAAGRPAGTDGLYLGLLAFLGFALLFALAIGNRTRPDIHRPLILFAMLPVIPPGVNRFWANALGLDDPIPTFWLYLTLWSMAAAILFHERRATGRIGGYSLIGAGWIVLEGALHEAVVGSAVFEQIAGGILGMVHYR